VAYATPKVGTQLQPRQGSSTKVHGWGHFDEAYLAARMAQCFRDLGEAGHAARYARRWRRASTPMISCGPMERGLLHWPHGVDLVEPLAWWHTPMLAP
jgi:hypothetical protein